MEGGHCQGVPPGRLTLSALDSHPMHQSRGLRLMVVRSVAALLLVSCATGSQSTTSVPTTVQSTTSSTALVRELINPGDILADASRYGDLVFTAGFLGDAPGDDFAADVVDALDHVEAALRHTVRASTRS